MDAEGKRKLSLAMPVRQEDKVIGAVYIVSSMEGLFETMNRIKQFLFTGTLIALVMTTILSILLSNMITAPIKEITSKAVAIAVGNLNQRVNIQSKDEIGQLGRAFNEMTARLKEALSSIEDEKEKLDSVLSNMNDGVIGSDENRRLIIMNRRARSMLSITADERVEGEEVLQLLGLEAMVIPEKAWTEGAVIVVPLRANMHQVETLTVKITFTPIHRRGVGVTGTVLLLHDITEQQILDESRKEFVANVSHELRTPLTTIKSYLEALDEGAIDEPTLAHKFVNVTRNETERMIRLVSDLLHLSKYDSQQKQFRRELTQLVPILEEVADRFAFQAQQRGIDFIIQAATELQPVYIDRDEIDQVLDNLISNAIKYSPDGGFITMTAQQINKQWAEVTVTDQGIGIPQKELSRVFERFYRVDKARSRDMGGTGLGLNIALEIVKAHGGLMKIESEQGAGTRIIFTLPNHTEDHEST
jgi:two-component system sensor histidine kinase VicK